MKRYRVVEDYQGGEFGMGRDYTAREWLEQAVSWRDSDDSWGNWGDGVDCYGNKHKDSRTWFIKFWTRMIKDGREQELIDYIADVWQIRIEPVRKIGVSGKSTTTPIKVKVLTKTGKCDIIEVDRN